MIYSNVSGDYLSGPVFKLSFLPTVVLARTKIAEVRLPYGKHVLIAFTVLLFLQTTIVFELAMFLFLQ